VHWTNDWWDNHRQNYDLVIGPNVLDELERGNYPTKNETLKLIEDVSILEITDGVETIVSEYLNRKLMPRDFGGDALHLALASYYFCHFLFNMELRTPGEC